MSGITDFVKKLLPRFERSSVAEDLRITEKEMLNATIPSWNAAVDAFKVAGIHSPDIQTLGKDVVYGLDKTGRVKGVNFIADIALRLQSVHDNAVIIQGVLDKYVERDIIREGLNARGAFLVRGAGHISFISQYALSLLNYVYSKESEKIDTAIADDIRVSRAEVKFVEENIDVFVRLLNRYSVPNKDFSKMVENIPEVMVGAAAAAVVASLYADADPISDAVVAGFSGSPVLMVRMVWARWQQDRYDASVAKKQQLELRLAYMETQRQKAPSPAIQLEIRSLQNRIEKLDRKIREVNEAYEVN